MNKSKRPGIRAFLHPCLEVEPPSGSVVGGYVYLAQLLIGAGELIILREDNFGREGQRLTAAINLVT